MADETLKPGEDPIEKMVARYRAWLLDPDPRPRQFRAQIDPIQTPNGRGRVFKVFNEEIVAQVTELPEPPCIIPAP